MKGMIRKDIPTHYHPPTRTKIDANKEKLTDIKDLLPIVSRYIGTERKGGTIARLKEEGKSLRISSHIGT